MKKLVFLEGLPNVGKTTILNYIKDMHLSNVHIVNEIENKEILDNINGNQEQYIKNDELKLNKFKRGVIVFDRGPISTLAYNLASKEINKEFDSDLVSKWFMDNLDNFSDAYVYYLVRNDGSYFLPYVDEKDPYGSVDNQRTLDKITREIIDKYFVNKKIVINEKKGVKELIDEIIS